MSKRGEAWRHARRIALWALLALAGALALYQGWFFGHILYWSERNPAATRFMQQRLDQMREKNPRAKLRHTWVSYAGISAHLKRAIVAAEDAKFVDHEGFDWDGMQAAMKKNLRRGRIVAGGSTITQQLAKNLFLSDQRSVVRKAQEAAITVMLEAVMDKRRILEIYLNVAEWGEGVFGAEAAARHYFGIPAADLSAEQSARLAAMLPMPRFYSRVPGSEYLARYSNKILARMPGTRIP